MVIGDNFNCRVFIHTHYSNTVQFLLATKICEIVGLLLATEDILPMKITFFFLLK